VEDIGDAMLLGRFIKELFDNQVTLITTSNTHPDNLYKDGLHRSRFLPAIESIKDNCKVYELDSAQDYRLRTLEQLEIFIICKEGKELEVLESNFSELTNDEYTQDRNIQILGRKIKTIKLSQGSVWLSFKEICEGPRSAKDYIEVCSEFHTLFVSNVPIMGGETDDSARRFIALVDEFYERNVTLIISAEAELTQLYDTGTLDFEFKRCISRLQEMQSLEYLSREHLA
jgi:cell division protein ZapE